MSRIGEIAGEMGCFFHTDAVTAVGHMAIDFLQLNVCSLALSAHKFGGPQGVGALLIKRECKIEPFIHGGGQERDIRSGTLNVPGIVGLSAALSSALDNFEQKHAKVWALREQLISQIFANVTGVTFNGSARSCMDPLFHWQLPGIVNLGFSNCAGDSLLFLLDGFRD